LTKQEYIEYWVETSKRDWKTVQNMFKSKDFVPALFFAHLVIEKLLKAHWVKNSSLNHPPKIHNLISLAGKIDYEFTDEELVFMGRMNDFQLEGRYPDYTRNIYKIYKAKETEPIIKEVDKLRKCLLKNLP
jgi:HEPN domain-containing protein